MKNYATYIRSEWTCHESEEVKQVHLAQMNIYQSTTHNKNLSWLKGKGKHQQFYISNSVVYLTYLFLYAP